MVLERDMNFINTISDIVTALCEGSVLAQGTLAQRVELAIDLLKKSLGSLAPSAVESSGAAAQNLGHVNAADRNAKTGDD